MTDAPAPYDGDLTIGKALAGAKRYITEHQTGYANGEPGDRCWEVLLGPLDPPTWDTATEWGRGPTLEDAWRWVLAALLIEPDTDPMTPDQLAG